MRPSTKNTTSKRKSIRRRTTGLGDSDTSMDDDSHSEVEDDDNAETFRSPQADNNATDYGLEFTASRIQLENSPRRCSTLRKQSPNRRRTQAEESDTQDDSDENENIENNPRRANTSSGPKRAKTTNQSKSTKPTAITQNRRKQKTPLRKQQLFEREVIRLQKTTSLLVPRLPFSRLIRELMHRYTTEIRFITATALEALQTASELYLTQRLQDAYMLTLHRGRVTLDVRDMMLINYLRANGE